MAKDSESQYVDINGHRYPTFPLAPVIIATKILTPDFDFNSVDILTSRNNLRKLFRWVNGKSDKDFRIDLEMVENTMVLTRYERKLMEPAGLGYGHEFEKRMTTSDITAGRGRTALSHNRVLSYVKISRRSSKCFDSAEVCL